MKKQTRQAVPLTEEMLGALSGRVELAFILWQSANANDLAVVRVGIAKAGSITDDLLLILHQPNPTWLQRIMYLSR